MVSFGAHELNFQGWQLWRRNQIRIFFRIRIQFEYPKFNKYMFCCFPYSPFGLSMVVMKDYLSSSYFRFASWNCIIIQFQFTARLYRHEIIQGLYVVRYLQRVFFWGVNKICSRFSFHSSLKAFYPPMKKQYLTFFLLLANITNRFKHYNCLGGFL